MTDDAGRCKHLHELLERLPLIKFSSDASKPLPDSGIYFFYENGEYQVHSNGQRIVRVGTHTGNCNLAQRISSHYISDSKIINLNPNRSTPKDRSIFRKHIGRAVLKKENHHYLKTWEIDFTAKENREKYSGLRDIPLEKRIETECSRLLQSNFSFRAVIVKSKEERLQMERKLIGTLSGCPVCCASDGWLGRHSPREKIREGRLWNVNYLDSKGLTYNDMQKMSGYVNDTKNWFEYYTVQESLRSF